MHAGALVAKRLVQDLFSSVAQLASAQSPLLVAASIPKINHATGMSQSPGYGWLVGSLLISGNPNSRRRCTM
jgi:hypothetical protein